LGIFLVLTRKNARSNALTLGVIFADKMKKTAIFGLFSCLCDTQRALLYIFIYILFSQLKALIFLDFPGISRLIPAYPVHTRL